MISQKDGDRGNCGHRWCCSRRRCSTNRKASQTHDAWRDDRRVSHTMRAVDLWFGGLDSLKPRTLWDNLDTAVWKQLIHRSWCHALHHNWTARIAPSLQVLFHDAKISRIIFWNVQHMGQCRVLRMQWNLSKFPHVPNWNVAHCQNSGFLGIKQMWSPFARLTLFLLTLCQEAYDFPLS